VRAAASEGFKHHQRHRRGFQGEVLRTDPLFGAPRRIDSFTTDACALLATERFITKRRPSRQASRTASSQKHSKYARADACWRRNSRGPASCWAAAGSPVCWRKRACASPTRNAPDRGTRRAAVCGVEFAQQPEIDDGVGVAQRLNDQADESQGEENRQRLHTLEWIAQPVPLLALAEHHFLADHDDNQQRQTDAGLRPVCY